MRLCKSLEDICISHRIDNKEIERLTGLYTFVDEFTLDRLALDSLFSCLGLRDLVMELWCVGHTCEGFCIFSKVIVVETSSKPLSCLFPTDDFRRGM